MHSQASFGVMNGRVVKSLTIPMIEIIIEGMKVAPCLATLIPSKR